MIRKRFFLTCISTCLCNFFCQPMFAQDKLNFDRDIRPILSENCYFCHGPDAGKREADLRLDEESAAKKSAIVAGKPDESELITRILSTDPDQQMPPPASKLTLTAAQKEKLRKWIEQGANYTQHWSMTPPAKNIALPEVKDANWCKSDLDRYVLARLEAAGLKPSTVADRATWLRRVTLDLTGLPPTIDELDAFVKGNDDGDYDREVERLLASERFGERMAVEWLDLARYADTYGYQADRYRAMWPWRDWVVKSFNQNLPYDQFIVWQLAGDLLPDATREQVLATAFNRNHRQTNEGGSVEEEFRSEYVADRVNTFGAAFLGLTLECARCHDHKYDPITQRDYYQLASFFNSIDESGLYSHFTDATPTPTLLLSSDPQSIEIEAAKKHIELQQSRLFTKLNQASAAFEAWRSKMVDPANQVALGEAIKNATAANLIADYPMESIVEGKLANRVKTDLPAATSESPTIVPGKVGNGIKLSGENNITFKSGGAFTRTSPFSFSLWMNTPRHFDRAVVFHRSRAWTDSGSRGYELLIEDGKLSVGLIHFYPGNAIRVIAKQPLTLNNWSHVTITYDGSSQAAGVRLYVDGQQVAVDIIRDCLTKNIHDDVKEVAIGQRFRDVGFKDGMVDEFKVFDRDLTVLEVQQLFANDMPGETSQTGRATIEPTSVQENALREFYLHTQDAEIHHEKTVLTQLRETASQLIDPITEIMVMKETPAPRPTYVLTRGAYDAPGAQVERDTPLNFPRMRPDWQKNRLGLAYWLVDRQHPLTARVAVNRFWQMVWGQGLVTTMEDFGLQGALPSNQELLDWLSSRFVDSGWNVKHLMKQIVLSATYRQSSNPNAELLSQDPENQLLARGPSHRLSAEMIRDLALFTGGLLVEKVGGPPVKPYQPEGLWEEKSGEKYQRDVGEGSHRRSLYTFWKRTSPPPSMMSFDATSREVCTVRRQVTLTPLQVLVLLNDPQYIEAARGLAERSMQHSTVLAEQLHFMFRSLTARLPTEKESQILMQLHSEQLREFTADATRAPALLKIGDRVVDAKLDGNHLAALTVVAEGLLSYDETVMKR
jgi:Protein of unknown function (DUF1553)/Protein of unknown function (DUF1549)/Concanavalin A-like lectin/glucanases superfamily/Planctomycete cytochrome C